MKIFQNKNALQWDAYHPLVNHIPACTVAREGVPAWGVVPAQGVYQGGVPAWGVYLPRGVPAWGVLA